jgi:hypothetical protein
MDTRDMSPDGVADGKKISFYFGCYGGKGHYLHNHAGEKGYPKELHPDFPWSIDLLDGGLLRNGKIPDRCDGKVYWTCGGPRRDDLWFAFYWWDRSVDERLNSNSGFYVPGFSLERGSALEQVGEAFSLACLQWPKVVSRQHAPLALQIHWRDETR